MRKWNVFWNQCLDVLFPSYCEGCGKSGVRICETCKHTLSYWRHSEQVSRIDTPQGVSILPPLFLYKKGELSAHLIHAFKYQGQRSLGCELALVYAKALEKTEEMKSYTGILEVPMHWLRLSSRGFNQSALLAQVLAKELQLPYLSKRLRRAKHTKRQVTLQMHKRKQNMRQAFVISRPEMIRGQRLLLVDDVLTTGATTFACAEVLLQAGAAGVGICALAIRQEERE